MVLEEVRVNVYTIVFTVFSIRRYLVYKRDIHYGLTVG